MNSIGILSGWGAGIALVCIAGLLLWKAAKRAGVEETARDVNEETEAEIKRMVDHAGQVRADDTTPRDPWL